MSVDCTAQIAHVVLSLLYAFDVVLVTSYEVTLYEIDPSNTHSIIYEPDADNVNVPSNHLATVVADPPLSVAVITALVAFS